MPGEISRSNPGPKGNTPWVPSWICLESEGIAWPINPEFCQYCTKPMREHKALHDPQEI